MTKNEVSNSGRPITKGDTPGSKYNNWMEANGFDKETILEKFSESDSVNELFDQIKKRTLALEFYALLHDKTSEFYNNSDKRALALTQQLIEVDADIKQHKLSQLELDPTYTPINDKQLLKWTELRAKLMADIRKEQLELTKMATDKNSVVNADDVDFDSI